MGDVLGVINKVAIAVTLIIVIALGLGTVLDRFLGTDRLFTFLFILGSVPLTLTAVYKISLSAVTKIQENMDAANDETEDDKPA